MLRVGGAFSHRYEGLRRMVGFERECVPFWITTLSEKIKVDVEETFYLMKGCEL